MAADHHLARRADAIVLGQVRASSVSDGVGMITTDYTIGVEEVFKGKVGDQPIMVRVPGGYLPQESRETVIFGTPTFSRGERVLLFLSWNQRWGYRILHISQGAFCERFSDGERYFVRPLSEPFAVELEEIRQETGRERLALARKAHDFQAWLRRADFSSDRSDEYLEVLPAAAEKRLLASAFTLVKFGDPPDFVYRWGANMTWQVDRRGIKKIYRAGKLLDEFEKLLEQWNLETGKTFRQGVDGTSGAENNFSPDGANVLQGRDRFGLLGGDFVCDEGGVVSVNRIGAGKPENLSGSVGEWKGRPSRRILEAGIIMNNNLNCLKRKANRRRVRLALLHELGHTIGIGHHCGAKLRLDCSASPAWRKSLMSANPFDGSISLKSPKLDEEDRNAAHFLYDPDLLTPVPCDRKPPGHKRFCRRSVCGPCGRGQGHCEEDKHCLEGLECVKNATRAGELGVPGDTGFCSEAFDLTGEWAATEIEGAIDANGNPLPISGSVSTWTFNADGTYAWFLHALPFFDFDGEGTYSLDGNRLTVTGIIANTLFFETPGSTDVIPLTLGNGTFRFQDEDGAHWTFAKVDEGPLSPALPW